VTPADPRDTAPEPVVDVIIAVHDERRAVERAVSSVLDGADGSVRVTVVCHGIPADAIRRRLGAVDEATVRVVEFTDGVRSAAGPFNHGLSLATAEFVSVMGSDDFLEPGAMRRWTEYVVAEKPDLALVRLRYQGGKTLSNPLARMGRRRRLDPVKDRVFYRTAPLGLLRRSLIERLGLRMTEGLRTGEDLAFGVRLWTSGSRIDYLRSLPAYVIGSDAVARVTTGPMSAREFFAPVNGILADPHAAALDAGAKRALAVKLVRIHVLGYVLSRPSVGDWVNPEDLAHVTATLRAILGFAPALIQPFPRADRDLLDALVARDATGDSVVTAIAAHRAAGRLRTIVPRSIARLFDRESVATRYLLYAVAR
jgi:hypothetical protein